MEQDSAAMLISICDARLTIRQHPLHARKITSVSGSEERQCHLV
jgi:hypothetical protein